MPRVEKDTNQVYRKKYFVAADQILGDQKVGPARRKEKLNSVLAASRVRVDRTPVIVRCVPAPSQPEPSAETGHSPIHVDVFRDTNQHINSIRIACPCGREATLNVKAGM